MSRVFSLLVVGASLVSGYRAVAGVARRDRACSRAHVTLFDEANSVKPTSITRSRESRLRSSKTGRIVVTGAGYSTRTLIQALHDFGTFGEITAFGDSIVESKKSLLTRTSRYSGLNDVLTFEEGALTPAMAGASAWLAINADEATLPEQIASAKEAGVSRIFLLLSAEGPTAALADVTSIEELLSSSGAEYTVMRTGSLVETGAGGGLKLDAIDMPVCEDVAKEDVFRFITESLTLGEASGRTFSLCPSASTVDALKQVRFAGYERREEVQMLLSGLIAEQQAAVEPTAEEAEEQAEAVMRSSAEVAAEREEELRMLLERARKRGEETQARLQYEEAEKEAHRKEQEKYYKAPDDAKPPSGEDTPTP